jgi:hypothetical protein
MYKFILCSFASACCCFVAACSQSVGDPVFEKTETHELVSGWNDFTISCEDGVVIGGGCTVDNPVATIRTNQHTDTGWYCSVSPGDASNVSLTIWADCNPPGINR